MSASERVVIGMDPHKRSVTIEGMSADAGVLGCGRFATDVDGFAAMGEYVSSGQNGSGRSRGATGSADTSRCGSWPRVRTWSTCRRNCRRGREFSRLVRDAHWDHLIGTPTPNPWMPGQGRPVKYLDSTLLPSPIGAVA